MATVAATGVVPRCGRIADAPAAACHACFFPPSSSKKTTHNSFNCDSDSIPQLTLQSNAEAPDKVLRGFIEKPVFEKILFSAESAGRREFLNEILRQYSIHASPVDSWQEFQQRDDERYFLIASTLQQGMTLTQHGFAVITENQLFGERAVQRRRRKYRKTRDSESTIQSLADLQLGHRWCTRTTVSDATRV